MREVPVLSGSGGLQVRVLVVDASSAARALLRSVIDRDPDLVLVGEASSGHGVVELVHDAQPDVLLLDVELPLADGLSVLSELRRSWPSIPVLVFSTSTTAGAAATVEALARGATDYVTKPSWVPADQARAYVESMVLPRLRRVLRRAAPLPPPVKPDPGLVVAEPRRVELVVVAASTGGPNALSQVVPALPASLAVPVLVVQHMPATFTPLLASRLDRSSSLEVVEASDGMGLEPGRVYLAPGDRHLGLASRSRLRVFDGPMVHSCRPAADVLFSSAARHFPGGVLAVVLTGMGVDGTAGSRDIVASGGGVLAQDQESSVVWGMPGSVVRAGLAYRVLTLGRIAPEVSRLSASGVS